MTIYTREFFRKKGQLGGRRQKRNVSPEDLSRWGKAGAKKQKDAKKSEERINAR